MSRISQSPWPVNKLGVWLGLVFAVLMLFGCGGGGGGSASTQASIRAAALTTAQSLTVGTAMTSFAPLTPSAGVAPYTYSVSAGSLPTGLSLDASTGAVTGTPSATYASANVVFSVHDANGVVANATSSVSFSVGAASVSISAMATNTAQSLTVGTAMASFSPLTPSGGVAPYTYSVTSGTLPAGLSLDASTGAVTGTPSATYAGTDVVFSVKDANGVQAGTSSSVNFTVVAAPVSISATATTTAQSLTVGTAMASLSPLTPSGGVAPYTYIITSGTLPAGLQLGVNTGAVTGTPTATYAAATVVFSVHDANGVVANTSSSVSFTVGAATVAISATATTTAQSLTVGTVMASFTPLTASGGVAPYTYSVSSGTLPAGLQLGVNTGAVTGTPTASYASANVVFSVKGANNVSAGTTSSVNFTVVAAPVSISATATTTAQSLTVGTAMASLSPLTPSGGVAPYTYIITSGSLPAGLSLGTSTGAVTGTPTATYASANVVFSVHDAKGVVANTTSTVSFTVGAATVAISATANQAAQSLTVGTAMASFTPLTASGGVAPYTYSVSSGTLPAGLQLGVNTGAVTGTPTASYASANVVFSVKGANNASAGTTSSVSFTVAAAPVSISAIATTTAQSLTVGTAMASLSPLTPGGGVAPYAYIITSGTLPAGLSLGTSTGAVTGTPTATYAAANVVFSVHDANGVVANTSSAVSFSVGAATVAISAKANTTAQSLTVGTAMTSFTPLTASGGVAPYTYSVASGTLPAGLQLGVNTGAVTGTPTASYASANVVFSVKGANNVAAGTSSSVSFSVVAAPVSISATATTTAQSLTVGTAMASLSPLTPSGGVAPYVYSYAGTLPTGLSLNVSTGAVTGTPTATYIAANVVFSVQDANAVVANTTSSVSFSVGAATVAISATATTTAQSLTVGTAMTSFTPLTASGGVAPYTYSVISGTLPTGLQLGLNTGAVTGTPSATYAASTVVFSVKGANNVAAGTTSSVSFSVVAAPVSISATATTTAQNLTVGTAMASFTPLTPSGGVAPYTYSINSGVLPAGLSLNTSTGAVTGTPSAIYTAANVVFAVQDANGVVASITSSVSFTVGAVSTVITATANPTNQPPYTHAMSGGIAIASFSPLMVSGGTPPYTYSVTQNPNYPNPTTPSALPPGLSFNTSTGVVTGTPSAMAGTTTGVWYALFSVMDANNVVASVLNPNFTTVYSYTAVTFKVLPPRKNFILFGLNYWPSASNETYTYAEATAMCSGTINGLTGWRMPTLFETMTLFDYYGTWLTPLGNSGWFLGNTWGTGVGGAGYARPPAPAGYAYAMNLAGGNGPVTLFADTTRLLATCVR